MAYVVKAPTAYSGRTYYGDDTPLDFEKGVATVETISAELLSYLARAGYEVTEDKPKTVKKR